MSAEEAKSTVEETPKGESQEFTEVRRRKNKHTEESEPVAAGPSSAKSVGANITKDLPKSPAETASFVKRYVELISSQRSFLIFVILWIPCLAMVLGLSTGILIKLALESVRFVIGGAAAFYVLKVVEDTKLADNVKAQQLLWLVSVAPIIMVLSTSNSLYHLLLVVAFNGAVFLLREYFPGDAKQSSSFNVQFLEVCTVPAVTFAVSCGGSGLLNSIIVAGIYLAALFATEQAWPHVSAQITNIVNSVPVPALRQRVEVVYGALTVVIAHLISMILSFVLPKALFGTQRNFFVSLFYTVFGLGLLVGTVILNAEKPSANSSNIKNIASMASCAVFVLLVVLWSL